jgi:hypothetical protein
MKLLEWVAGIVLLVLFAWVVWFLVGVAIELVGRI